MAGIMIILWGTLLALLVGSIILTINISALRLPIPLSLQLLTTLLPLLSAMSTAYRPASARLHHTLHSLLGALTTILGTLYLSAVVPSDANACVLATTWQRFWMARDGRAIREVQDALGCCGFNSVKDRAWPFPRGPDNNVLQCAEQFRRTTSCAAPWGAAMRRDAGLAFGIVVAVGIVQILNVLHGHPVSLGNGSTWRDWFRTPRKRMARMERARQRLLTNGGEPNNEPYDEERDRAIEEGPSHHADNDDDPEHGPRVQPSGLTHHEANEWSRE